MKEKYFNDLGLDNGEDILKKFNLLDLVKSDKEKDDKEEEKAKNKKIDEIKKNI
jgi:hypothetical protein